MSRFEKFDHMFQTAGLSLSFKENTAAGLLAIWDGYCRSPHVTFRKFGGPEAASFVTVWSLVRDGENDIHSYSGIEFRPFADGLLKGKEARIDMARERAREDIDAMMKMEPEYG